MAELPAWLTEKGEGSEIMRFTSLEDLVGAGFQGFFTIDELRRSQCRSVPKTAGVYVVVRLVADPPRFLAVSPGGHFKGKDPTVPVSSLQQRWVNGTVAVYIGKAGGQNSSATLQRRLGSYMRFGAGKAVGHWGGRLIWQLADHLELQVGWRQSSGADPRAEERTLLDAFESNHGVLPFANLVH